MRWNERAFGLYPRYQSKEEVNAYLGSIPATIAGCPTSRSFFARCGIPQAFPSSAPRSPQIYRGAPGSPKRTWAEKRWAKPNHSLSFQTLPIVISRSKRRAGGAFGLYPATNRRVPHPSRSLRRVGYANLPLLPSATAGHNGKRVCSLGTKWRDLPPVFP
jgi:hypothetical protein